MSTSAEPNRDVSASRTEALRAPVEELPGVTPGRAELLRRVGLETARDVLFYFPRDYCDLTDVRPIRELEEGVLLSAVGTVEDIDSRQLRGGKTLVGVLLRDHTDFLRGLWFNLPYMRTKFQVGQRVMFSGKAKRNGPRWEMSHPRVQWLGDEEEEVAGRLLPIYGLTEGLKQRHVRWLMRVVLERFGSLPEEVLPEAFLAQYELWPLARALPAIHFPRDREELAQARRRLVFQELLVLQLGLAIKRRQLQDQSQSPPLECTALIDARIRRLFPYELTAAQRQAIAEVVADLARAYPMQRLLQGDVGSGKTSVAVYAMLLAVAHGYQAALMAPTEVLARQHFATLQRLLADSHVRRGLLVGGMGAKERETLLRAMASGDVDLVVGTQAVVQEGVEFSHLGLAVIDEQHKFGVRQRAQLKSAGKPVAEAPSAAAIELGREATGNPVRSTDSAPSTPTPPSLTAMPAVASAGPVAAPSPHGQRHWEPHYLVMTATPIPRTIAMSLFGDLDVSTLRETPPGRQPVHTYLAGPERRPKWWEFFRKKLRQGRQGFVVAPLVEDSAEIEAASVEAVYEALTNGELADFTLGLMHGRMTSAEKLEVMQRFHRRQVQVLVATSLVEVGIDVPNATLMTIEAGQRFGLSQLHQLRGRICRGQFPGYCCVFADPASPEAQQRLEAFASSTDGFELAEADLALRGPGELFGVRQHGMPPFRIADLARDSQLLLEARQVAQALIAADPGLAHTDYARLRRMVLARYGRVLDLGAVG